jgi:hypothetical protein
MYSVSVLQNLIAFGYRGYEELAADLDQTPQMLAKLCNLVHQELGLAHLQWLEHYNKGPLKRAKDKTANLLNKIL